MSKYEGSSNARKQAELTSSNVQNVSLIAVVSVGVGGMDAQIGPSGRGGERTTRESQQNDTSPHIPEDIASVVPGGQLGDSDHPKARR